MMKPWSVLLACALSLACGASTSSGAAPESPPDPPTDPGQPSGGCSAWRLAAGVTTGSLSVGGVARTYVLSAPARPAGPIPVVFAFHGMGSNGADFRRWTSGMGLESAAAGPTVFVYPDALVASASGQSEWDDAGGRDTAFFDALLARLQADACVAAGRVFVTGFSYGGFMSNGLGCKRAGTVRAIAPLSGGGPYGTCNGQRVAAWLATGSTDSLLPQGRASRDHWVAANGCQQGAAASTPRRASRTPAAPAATRWSGASSPAVTRCRAGSRRR